MRKKNPPFVLPASTPVELVGTKGTKVAKKELSLEDALKEKQNLEKDKKWSGWVFRLYQIGFSQFKIK